MSRETLRRQIPTPRGISLSVTLKMRSDCERAVVKKKISVNPSIVFRDEFDDLAILFDPDSGKAFSINRTGALIWKSLDGKRSISDIVNCVNRECKDTANDVALETQEFIDHLVRNGLAGYVV